jgi:hypothetical protein
MDVYSTELGIRLSFGKNFGIFGGGSLYPQPPLGMPLGYIMQRNTFRKQYALLGNVTKTANIITYFLVLSFKTCQDLPQILKS